MKSKTWIMAAAGVALLVSCGKKEVILPGEREDLRTLAEPVENTAPAVSLASQTRNSSWTHRIGTQKYRVSNAALSANPTLVWSAPIGKGENRKSRVTADPVVAEGRIFTMDAEATLSATSTSGAPLWSRDLTPPRDKAGNASTGGLAYGEGLLFATTGFGSIRAFDPKTGADVWEQKLQAVGSGTPTVYGGLVYLVSGDATGWAIDAKTGKVIWQALSLPDVQNVQSPSAPAVDDRLVYFPYGSGEVQANFRRGGISRWTAGISDTRPGRASNTVGDLSGDPVLVGSRLYVANHSGRMVALDTETGERIWTADEGALSPVFPAGNSLFFVSDRNRLMRLDARDGTLIWQQELPYFTKDKPRRQSTLHVHYGPIIAGNRLVVASSDELLRLFDPKSGEAVYTAEIPGGAATNPVVADGVLYIVSGKGQLHAFR
ncbi:PQQ-binding-like beta-propeller repeat protein [Shimia haliotis]|nr:PQQ-binding-like beta-propeller repeat protein [Shimia haliotis]